MYMYDMHNFIMWIFRNCEFSCVQETQSHLASHFKRCAHVLRGSPMGDYTYVRMKVI